MAADLPPGTAGRLTGGAFSSALSARDFAACLHMGLRPVGLVQGFCVMRWSWYGPSGLYARTGVAGQSPWGSTLRTYACPHYMTSLEHRSWGENFEQSWVTQAWTEGFTNAYRRMLEEASEAGAHGVIGVVDTTRVLTDSAVREFHIYGTAVVVEEEDPPRQIWTSYLAGQRLAKLVEAGFMPVSIVATMASVRMWAVCVTEMLMSGQYSMGGMGGGIPGVMGGGFAGGMGQASSEIAQLADAQADARRIARDRAKAQLGPDTLHGARLECGWHEIAAGDAEVHCTLRGTRVTRFKVTEPLPPPVPTVHLS